MRTVKMLFGLVLYALGVYLSVQGNIGLGPWDAFSSGVSAVTGLSFGDVVVLTGAVILVIDALLHEKIGFATILNTLLIGKIVDLFNVLELVPKMQHFWPGLLLLLLGQVCLCLAMYYYVSPGLGAGPRDSLMIALGKRLPNWPIGVVRGMVEGVALAIGWALGAKVGVGTVIAVFGISIILQATFRLLRFNIKAVRHESLMETVRTITFRAEGHRAA